MTRDEKLLLLLLGGAGVAYWWYTSTPTDPTSFAASPVDAISDAIVSTVSGWAGTNEGPTWVPVLNATEANLGIPTNLLARLAYQESHFRDDIIRGTTKSSAGALGIMQFLPTTSPTVSAPIPFADSDVEAQIQAGGAYLVAQYNTFGSWDLALAAYNAGPGNVTKYGGVPPFTETQNYVAQILADVPGVA
jgi:soluble lytic murein transglycosylase-like protein